MTREEFQAQVNKTLATYEDKLKNIYVVMHETSVRGKGYCDFVGRMTFAQLVNEHIAEGNLYIKNRDDNGRFIKPYLADCDGNEVSTDNPKGLTGILEYDGYYDRYICVSLYDAINDGRGYEWDKALEQEIDDDVYDNYASAHEYLHLKGRMFYEGADHTMVYEDILEQVEYENSDEDDIAMSAITLSAIYGIDPWDTYNSLNAIMKEIDERGSLHTEEIVREWVSSIYTPTSCNPFKIYF